MKIPFCFFDRSEYITGEHRIKQGKEIPNSATVSVKLPAQNLIH